MAILRGISSKRGGIFKAALALLTFSGAAGVLGWMLLLPGALRTEVEARTGFPVEVETLACNPFGLTLSGEQIVVGNPSAYGGGDPMLEIESLKADASLPSLGRGEIWVYDLELRVKRATLALDERGRLNLDAFASRLLVGPGDSGETPFFVERVRLVVDELVFVDNSRLVPTRKSVRALLDVELSDLESPQAVFAPLRELAKTVGAFALD